MFTRELGNPHITKNHYQVTCFKHFDILDYFVISKYMKKYCKDDWYSIAKVLDNNLIIDLYFDSLNDFCHIKLICNEKYNFVRE